ncbi:12-oxophytodienoate reductase [Seminavis robusta]|uniref:12-oxophytodienoate reductase n=1 Tax=Seminavis robusta TaxID=568900 RepID=A0A9N8HQF3_9STRA|nr:12-oxophytodienoate reductase [Seminavis robusta]|eukprot:Sro1160_g247690.1 12-oxophytodienoate reductase (141) ;mRNA; f:10218-10640
MGDYYEQRANGNLLITEGTIIWDDGAGWRNAPRIDTQQHAEAWKPIIDRVHAKDALVYCQLWRIGRQSHTSHHPESKRRIVGPSEIAIEGKVKTVDGQDADPEVPHALTIDEIKSTVLDYCNAAKVSGTWLMVLMMTRDT